MVRQVAVPPGARTRSTLHRFDYEDAFVLDTGVAHERTGEEWARAMLEDAPAGMQRSLRRAWCALGLRLGSTGDERRVLGWEVRRRAPEFALLAASSWLGMLGEVLVERSPRVVLVATFIQTRNPLARLVWAGVSPGHRQAVRDCSRESLRGAQGGPFRGVAVVPNGKAVTMGLLRGLFRAVGGLLAGVFGLLRGLLTGLGSLLRRIF